VNKGILRAAPLIVLLFLQSCVQDPLSVRPVVPVPSAKGVYVLNEGTFGRGNATLTFYDLETFQVYNDVFASVNGRNLGDVGNQMVIRGTRGYIIVNNSDKIEVLDLQTNRSAGTIPVGSGRSPRQLAFISDSLGLVTALYDASVLVVDFRAMAVVGRIPVGENPEGIVIARGKAYVANSGFGNGRTMSVVDLATMSSSKTITVGDNPSGVALSTDGLVYVVCGGSYGDYSNPADDTPAKVTVVNPSNDAVVDSIILGGHASVIALSADGWGYIPTTDGVMAIDTRSNRLVGTFVKGSFYGAGVEVVSGDVYLTDPKDFVQPGEIAVYAPNGQLRTRFQGGVIPGSIAFKR
jgi:YVTN family beta-propeller protein